MNDTRDDHTNIRDEHSNNEEELTKDLPGEESTDARPLPKDDIRELIKLMTEGDVVELSLETGHTKLFIKREGAYGPRPTVGMPGLPVHLPHGAALSLLPTQHNASQPPPSPVQDNLIMVTSPMVGTFYRSASPKDKPYVEVGDMVEKGQVIGIIEAMKMMNEIPAEQSGKVSKILVENGNPVEYNTPLLALEPLTGTDG